MGFTTQIYSAFTAELSKIADMDKVAISPTVRSTALQARVNLLNQIGHRHPAYSNLLARTRKQTGNIASMLEHKTQGAQKALETMGSDAPAKRLVAGGRDVLEKRLDAAHFGLDVESGSRALGSHLVAKK